MRRLALVLALATALAPAVAADVFDVPGRYRVAGRGEVKVDELTFDTPHIDVEYVVHPDRSVTLTRLRAEPVGRVLVITTRFLDLFEVSRTEVPLLCPLVVNDGVARGTVDAVGNLHLAAGARVVGVAYEEGGPFLGGCPGSGAFRRVTAAADRPLSGRHDPAANRFLLAGTFSTVYEGESLTIDLQMEGAYTNRPPLAALGVEGEGLPSWLVQGGCPPLSGLNPPAAEANDPEGLRLVLQSNSWDADGRLPRSDLAYEQWGHWQGGPPGGPGSAYAFLGAGRRIGPVLFRLDTQHTLVLTVTDRAGAENRTGCGFAVVDRTPPTVTPPPEITVPCTRPAGATAARSAPLAAFLAAGSAADVVDPAPLRLPPQVAGVEVTDETLFPLGARTPVAFRWRDRSGNLGSERSWVTVTGRPLRELTIGFDTEVFPATFRWVRLRPRLLFPDVCGGLIRLFLTEVDTDGVVEGLDRFVRRLPPTKSGIEELEVLAAPAGSEQEGWRDRVYELTYLAVDAAGNQETIGAKVVVRAPGAANRP